jgi:nucleoside-diphosphate-sugar epimerase
MDSIETVEQLEASLSEPTPGVIDAMAQLRGDVIVLGVGGKMGPTLARMIRRASDAAGIQRRVIGVSRFSSASLPDRLKSHGIEPIAADLLDRDALAALPDAPNIVFMAGMKFGGTGQEALTWAMNCHLPSLVCERYPGSRIVAFSTGNIYGLTPVDGGGSLETDLPNPLGDYAMSCLGRERMFEHFSRTLGIPMVLVRLNYAVELRYGVLVDLARKVWAGEPIDVSMGYVNVIWQTDATAMALRSFAHAASPPFALNIAGPEALRVREVCGRFGQMLDRKPKFHGTEASTALLSNGSRGHRLFGPPATDVETMIHRIADWVRRGGETLGKPTRFESRDGRF